MARAGGMGQTEPRKKRGRLFFRGGAERRDPTGAEKRRDREAKKQRTWAETSAAAATAIKARILTGCRGACACANAAEKCGDVSWVTCSEFTSEFRQNFRRSCIDLIMYKLPAGILHACPRISSICNAPICLFICAGVGRAHGRDCARRGRARGRSAWPPRRWCHWPLQLAVVAEPGRPAGAAAAAAA